MTIKIKMLSVTEQQASDAAEAVFAGVDVVFSDGSTGPNSVGYECTLSIDGITVGYDLARQINTTVKSLQARSKIYAVAITDEYHPQRPLDITDTIIN